MRFIATFEGRWGSIVIMEDRDTGARSYYEEGVFQAYATPEGISRFAYVQLMARLLQPACRVLALGCASGSIATMLARQGRHVTLVDDSPVSFGIARTLFSLSSEVRCVVSDFRDFLAGGEGLFDGIAIDIGAPSMKFDDEFDPQTCAALRSNLAPSGRMTMNVLQMDEVDAVPDRILAMLAGEDLRGWMYREPAQPDGNCILYAAPELRPCLGATHHAVILEQDRVDWELHCQRLSLSALPFARSIIMPATARQDALESR